jgi:hypothetical protein
VLSALPQLSSLDGTEITRTERLKANKLRVENRMKIIQQEVRKNWFFKTSSKNCFIVG